jgi:hypothetical protein
MKAEGRRMNQAKGVFVETADKDAAAGLAVSPDGCFNE